MEKNYVVLAKQVPDTKRITGKAMKDDGTVNRAALPAIFNPDDIYAMELALRMKDLYGGKVTLITMGPPSANEILRQGLYRGVDKGILLTDRRFAGSDTLATSMVLSKAIAQLKSYTVILCGRQAIDGDTAQVGPQVAEKLGLPQITYVEEIISLSDTKIEVKRIIENGFAVQESKLPVLLTCCSVSNAFPRPASAKKIQIHKNATTYSELFMKFSASGISKEEADKLAKQKLSAINSAIEEWNLEKIAMDESLCGLAGSPTWVKQIESVVLAGKEHKKVNPTDEGISSLVLELIDNHILD